MIRKTFYYPAQSYNVPEIIKSHQFTASSLRPPLIPSTAMAFYRPAMETTVSTSANLSVRQQPLSQTGLLIMKRPKRKLLAEGCDGGTHLSDLAQATVPTAPQQSSGKARREGARHVPPLAQGAGPGGTAAAGRTEPSEGVQAGKGDPLAAPCRGLRGTGAGAGGVSVSVTPPATDGATHQIGSVSTSEALVPK